MSIIKYNSQEYPLLFTYMEIEWGNKCISRIYGLLMISIFRSKSTFLPEVMHLQDVILFSFNLESALNNNRVVYCVI